MRSVDGLKPNADVMFDILSQWFRECNKGEIEIGWRDPVAGKLNRFKRFGLDEIEELAAFAADINCQPGANMYFRPATVTGTAPATDDCFAQTPGFWVDHDVLTSVNRLKTHPLLIKPPFIIVTGRDPEMRCQSFWPLSSDPVIKADWVRSINKALQTHFEGDPAVTNPTRLMRMPGSIAWPVKEGRTKAELVEVIAPKDGRPRGYSLNTITDVCRNITPPEVLTQPALSSSQPGARLGTEEAPEASEKQQVGWWDIDTGPSGVSIAGLIRQVGQPHLWHQSVLRLVASWVNRGWSDAEILLYAPSLTTSTYKVGQTREELLAMIKGAREKWGLPDKDPLADATIKAEIALWVDNDIDITGVPPRPWVAYSYAMRGVVSFLSGAGSSGKSSLVVQMSNALASGLPFGDFKPIGPLRVGTYNCEDDKDEQRRRYTAAFQAWPQLDKNILKNIYRIGPETIGTLFQEDPKTREVTPTAAMAKLERLVREERLDVLFVDPLLETHSSDENDNGAMRRVIAAYRSMAQRLNIAIIVLTHERKGGGAAGDIDRMRGASSQKDASRIAITVTRMTAEEATKYGIDQEEKNSYVRLDNGKSNYSPLKPLGWYRLQGYQIPNGEYVAAAMPWQPPSVLEAISTETAIKILLDMTRRPPEERKIDRRAKPHITEWIVEDYGIPHHAASAWIAACLQPDGVLEAQTVMGKNRHPVMVAEVKREKLSKMMGDHQYRSDDEEGND